MSKEYNQEQLWKLYEKLPQVLKEAIFSEETAENIFDICLKNKIKDNQISEVARYTGRVLFGILTLDELQENLESRLQLKKDTAKKVTQEIDRLILAPTKNLSTKPAETTTLSEEKTKRSPGKDTYRETVE